MHYDSSIDNTSTTTTDNDHNTNKKSVVQVTYLKCSSLFVGNRHMLSEIGFSQGWHCSKLGAFIEKDCFEYPKQRWSIRHQSQRHPFFGSLACFDKNRAFTDTLTTQVGKWAVT
jgi:hypothetical protein